MRRVGFGALVCLAVTVCSLVGCVVRSDRPRVPRSPRDPVIDRVLLSVAPPRDTNADGTTDAVIAVVHFFDSSYPLSLASDGQMSFQLVAEGQDLYAWTFSVPEVVRARQRSQVGIVHEFDLRMDESVASWIAGDLRTTLVDLRASFSPSGGDPDVGDLFRGIPWNRTR